MSYQTGLESNYLKHFKVSLNGIELGEQQVLELNISWDIDDITVQGHIIFLDGGTLVEETKIRGGDAIIMNMTDSIGGVSEEILQITEVRYTKTKSGKYVCTLKFMDPLTIETIEMYPVKSYQSADMVKIITDKEILGEFLTLKEKDFSTPKNPHINFVIPSHINFYSVIKWLKENNNLLFYQNRKKYIIKEISEIFKQTPNKPDYYYKAPNQSYRQMIYEFEILYGEKTKSELLQPDANAYAFNIEEKEYHYIDNNYKKAIDQIEDVGSVKQDFYTYGQRLFYKSYNHLEEQLNFQYQRAAIYDISLEILVPGLFDTNVGDTISINIPGDNKELSPENNLTGVWVITKLVDIIKQGEFIQKMYLSRAKFNK